MLCKLVSVFFNHGGHGGGNTEGAEEILCAFCVSSSVPSVVKKTGRTADG